MTTCTTMTERVQKGRLGVRAVTVKMRRARSKCTFLPLAITILKLGDIISLRRLFDVKGINLQCTDKHLLFDQHTSLAQNAVFLVCVCVCVCARARFDSYLNRASYGIICCCFTAVLAAHRLKTVASMTQCTRFVKFIWQDFIKYGVR